MLKALKIILIVPYNLFSKAFISNLILEGFKDINIKLIEDELVYLNLVFFFKKNSNQNDQDLINGILYKIEKVKKNLVLYYKKKSEEVNNIKIKEISLLDYQEYVNNYIEPFEVKNFMFLPYGYKNHNLDDLAKNDKIKIIYLYPKYLAFGNEKHPTTLGVIEVLADIKKYYDKEIDLVIDYGAGNGILSLVSFYLNPKLILAIEAIFSYCFEIKNNFAINKVLNGIVLNSITPKIINIKGFKNVITLANIPFRVFKDIANDLFNINSELFVLSGIKEEDIAEFQDFLKYNHLIVIETILRDHWGTFVCKKNSLSK